MSVALTNGKTVAYLDERNIVPSGNTTRRRRYAADDERFYREQAQRCPDAATQLAVLRARQHYAHYGYVRVVVSDPAQHAVSVAQAKVDVQERLVKSAIELREAEAALSEQQRAELREQLGGSVLGDVINTLCVLPAEEPRVAADPPSAATEEPAAAAAAAAEEPPAAAAAEAAQPAAAAAEEPAASSTPPAPSAADGAAGDGGDAGGEGCASPPELNLEMLEERVFQVDIANTEALQFSVLDSDDAKQLYETRAECKQRLLTQKRAAGLAEVEAEAEAEAEAKPGGGYALLQDMNVECSRLPLACMVVPMPPSIMVFARIPLARRLFREQWTTWEVYVFFCKVIAFYRSIKIDPAVERLATLARRITSIVDHYMSSLRKLHAKLLEAIHKEPEMSDALLLGMLQAYTAEVLEYLQCTAMTIMGVGLRKTVGDPQHCWCIGADVLAEEVLTRRAVVDRNEQRCFQVALLSRITTKEPVEFTPGQLLSEAEYCRMLRIYLLSDALRKYLEPAAPPSPPAAQAAAGEAQADAASVAAEVVAEAEAAHAAMAAAVPPTDAAPSPAGCEVRASKPDVAVVQFENLVL